MDLRIRGRAESTIIMIALKATGSEDLQINPTLAAGDVQLSKDGGAFVNLTSLPTVTPGGDTNVKISLSADEMNGLSAVKSMGCNLNIHKSLLMG